MVANYIIWVCNLEQTKIKQRHYQLDRLVMSFFQRDFINSSLYYSVLKYFCTVRKKKYYENITIL